MNTPDPNIGDPICPFCSDVCTWNPDGVTATCASCNEHHIDPEEIDCTYCNGTGLDPNPDPDDIICLCPFCNGDGNITNPNHKD